MSCHKHPTAIKITVDAAQVCFSCFITRFGNGTYQGQKIISKVGATDKNRVGKGIYDAIAAGKVTTTADSGFAYSYVWQRKLDELAGTLVNQPLVGRTCVALVCHNSELIVSENDTAPGFAELKEVALQTLKTNGLNPTKFTVVDKNGFQTFSLDGYMSKEAKANPATPDIHAELRILEYLHARLPVKRQKPVVYFGISLPCCAKCYTVIEAYNAWPAGKITVGYAGHHPSYDAHWRLPKGLSLLKPQLPMEYRLLKHAVHRG